MRLIERGRHNTLSVYEFPHGGRAVRKRMSIALPDAHADRSGAFVFDARDLARGALAKAWFGHMIPRPRHGTWTGGR